MINFDVLDPILFGAFVAFAVIFFLGISYKKIESYWFLIAPLIGGFVCYIGGEFISKILYYVLLFLDFPFSFIEICLYTQLVLFISRYILSLNPKRDTPYKVIISVICIPILVAVFYIFLRGFETNFSNFNFLHGIAVGACLFSFVYCIIADNGILTDAALISLKTALCLAPKLMTDSLFNKVLRTLIAIISTISYMFRYDEQKSGPKVLQAIFKRIAKTQTQKSLVAMMLIYIFLSRGAFIEPKQPVSDLQAISCPLVFIFYLLNEALYYHTHATPVPTK
jgi:hypothetical protein